MSEQAFRIRPGVQPFTGSGVDYWALPLAVGDVDPVGSPRPREQEAVSLLRRSGPRAGDAICFDLDSLRSYVAGGGILGSVALTGEECAALVALAESFLATRRPRPLGPRSRLSPLAARLATA